MNSWILNFVIWIWKSCPFGSKSIKKNILKKSLDFLFLSIRPLVPDGSKYGMATIFVDYNGLIPVALIIPSLFH